MPRHRSLFFLLLAGLSLVGFVAWGSRAQFGWAAEELERKVEIVVPYVETQWWLTRWSDNQIECQIFVDHKGLPTHNDVYAACGEELYNQWKVTQPCPEFEEQNPETESCKGLYLFQANQQQKEKDVVIELPLPEAWLSLSGCIPQPPKNQCDRLPDLVVTAEEPLPNEQINAIHVRIGEQEVQCEGDQCYIPLVTTPLSGIEIEFWAESSFGDTSEHFTGQVRVIDGGITEVFSQQVWFVDVISSQWRGAQLASCAQTWEAFPPIGGPPEWLSTPLSLDDMATDEPFVFLAGQLITQRMVDATGCPGGGLLPNGTANTCGLKRARDAVNEWQDRFDAAIIQIAEETNIPAQLMKNLFAIESQFWPGMLIPQEFGFGQMTELGADTTLLWNNEFFDQFCPLVLEQSVCDKGYLRLNKNEQALLRGAITARTDARCSDCPQGIDLAHAEFSIQVFAQTLLANCEQVGRILYNATGESPGEVSTYEDLWRFTLVNYNAGPGCLSNALNAIPQGRLITWQEVSPQLERFCKTTIPYVEKITAYEVVPTTTAPGAPSLSPTPTPLQTLSAPTPTSTVAGPYPPPPTATPGAYPPPPTATPGSYPPPPTSVPGYP